MSFSTMLWRLAGNPSILGLAAAVGERCVDTTTGLVYVKNNTTDTDWIAGTTAYGGGAGGGASTADAFVTIGHPADLTAERALASTATIDVNDGGANGTVSFSLNVAGATAALGFVSSVAGTAPVTSSGGTTPNIGISTFGASGAGHARGAVPDPGAVSGTTKFLREDASWQVPASSGGLTLTEVEKDLGSTPMTSGHFDITGLAGLTPNAQVLIMQKAAAYTGKGALFDEMEMDQVVAGGYVVDAATIRVYWRSTGPVRGNVKFGWTVSS